MNRFRPKKNFSTKIFWLCHFFTILGFLAEKRLSPSKKNRRENIFDFEIFGLKYVLKHSESIPNNKIFDQNFYFAIFHHFGRKTTESKKIYTGKNFRFWDFRFKLRFETFRIDSDQKKFDKNFLTLSFFSLFCQFWIDSDQKKFRPNFFDFVIFSLFWPFWPKND